MAWLQKIRGYYHISLRFGGRKFKRSLKTHSNTEVSTRKSRLEETIRLVESGRLEIPADADVAFFLLSDEKMLRRNGATGKTGSRQPVTLIDTLDAFFQATAASVVVVVLSASPRKGGDASYGP